MHAGRSNPVHCLVMPKPALKPAKHARVRCAYDAAGVVGGIEMASNGAENTTFGPCYLSGVCILLPIGKAQLSIRFGRSGVFSC